MRLSLFLSILFCLVTLVLAGTKKPSTTTNDLASLLVGPSVTMSCLSAYAEADPHIKKYDWGKELARITRLNVSESS